MRDESRKFPTVKTLKHVPRRLQRAISSCNFIACHNTGLGVEGWEKKSFIVFCEPSRTIVIDECVFYLNVLIHEINHWAQTMYIDDGEVLNMMNAYHRETAMGRTPFTEWINVEGGYNMEMWENKYGRKYRPD
jgi:hypothetical protein